MWHRVIPAASFASALPDLLAAPPPRVAFFNAATDPATGKPWCPDCARSVAAIKSGVSAAGGSLLEVDVGARADWKGVATHVARVQPPKISGVPTLVAYSAGGDEVGRLGARLEAAADEAAAAAVVEEWLKGL
jgi:Eukaryotic protein of unknown function (DUF953)